ncbi:MAG: hypothetical protein B6I20_02845 [Bacteroidetes bacterium 4572_117]|nr:MAG: hypothetical protein B6I20_02845 [Bacteroidetes bacterium 4572_117]
MINEKVLHNRITFLEKENKELKDRLLAAQKANYSDSSPSMENELNLQFKTIFSQSPDSIFQIDSNGFIINCNKAFADSVGLSIDQIIQKHAADFIVDKRIFKKKFRILQTKGYSEIELDQLNADASVTKVWRKAVALVDKENKFTGAIIFNRDITSRIKQAELQLELSNKYERLNEKLLKLNFELKEKSKKYRDIYNVPSESIFIHELETGIVVDVNQSIFSMYGYLPKEIIGQTAEHLSAGYEPFSQKEASEKIYKAMNIGPQTFDWLAKRKDGKLFWVEVNLKLGNIGGTDRVLASVTDITKRKGQEKILIESEERFRAIYENSPDIIIFTQLDNLKTISVNKTYTNIMGYTFDEIKDKTASELNIWVDENEHLKLRKLFDEKKRVDDFEAVLRKKTGEKFHSLISIRQINVNGVKHIIQIIHDITSRKKAELALKESEEKFKELADLSPTSIIIYHDSKFVYVNNATSVITGYSEKELLNMNFWDPVHPDMQNIVKERAGQRLDKQDVVNRYDLKLLRKNGEVRWVDFSATYINYNGKPAGIGNLFDITDNIKAQKALIKAKQKAEESDRLKSAFLANMSHEIRTPMNGIVGFSELLSLNNLTSELKEKYIEVIRQSSDQLLHIIDDILDISKIEVGELKIVKNELNVNTLLGELEALFLTHLQKQNKPVKLLMKETLKNKEEIIYSDKFRIHQILNNLLGNALKFTDKGTIEFGCYLIAAKKASNLFNVGISNKKRLLFFVKDSGHGIPVDKQKIIFDRFRQSDESNKKVFGGTGLGLSISKGLVQILGGKIQLISKINKGSIFYFTLPVEKKDYKNIIQ